MTKVPWWPSGDTTCPSPEMPEFDQLPWPDKIPFLVAADVCVEEDGERRPDGPGRFTLSDWVRLTFQSSTCQCCVIEGLLNCLEQRLGKKVMYHHMSEMPPGGSLRILAESWNSVMKVIGYTK